MAPLPSRACRIGALVVLSMCLAGCDGDGWRGGFAWSPDGSRAAFFANDSLYVMEADGRLSPPLGSGISGGAWIGDSEHLVLVKTREIRTFEELSEIIGPDRTRNAVMRAEALGERLERTAPDHHPEDDMEGFLELAGEDAGAVALYLLEHYREAVRLHSAATDAPEETRFELDTLVRARLVQGQLRIGATIYEDLWKIGELRVSPDARLIGFTATTDEFIEPKTTRLWVVPADGSTQAALVSEAVGDHFDWTPDSSALIYFSQSQLKRTAVSLTPEEIEVVEPATSLASVIFGGDAQVRCLRDGRILFNAAEFHYPRVDDLVGRQQLFALEVSEKTTLRAIFPDDVVEQLPRSLAHFEVSPNETEVLFVDDKQAVILVELIDGHIERLEQPGGGVVGPIALPTWRNSGELTWVRRLPGREELLLHQRAGEFVLNRGWSSADSARLLR